MCLSFVPLKFDFSEYFRGHTLILLFLARNYDDFAGDLFLEFQIGYLVFDFSPYIYLIHYSSNCTNLLMRYSHLLIQQFLFPF